VLEMLLHRPATDREPGADLPIRFSLGDEGQDLMLAVRERAAALSDGCRAPVAARSLSPGSGSLCGVAIGLRQVRTDRLQDRPIALTEVPTNTLIRGDRASVWRPRAGSRAQIPPALSKYV
jgi:hypothetical protein